MNKLNIVKASKTEVDIDFIVQVYNFYIENSTATFHTEPIDSTYVKSSLPFNAGLYDTYILKYDGECCGFCYLGNYKPREAYNRSAEISIYILPKFKSKGIGTTTLFFLEQEAIKRKLKNIIAVITAENLGSISLFEKAAYIKVGYLKNIGEKFNRILDVATYQKEL